MRAASLALLFAALAGCSSGTEATASQNDEAKFRNPAPIDTSKLPANAFDRPGPHFVGEPSGASNPSGSAPPAGVLRKGG